MGVQQQHEMQERSKSGRCSLLPKILALWIGLLMALQSIKAQPPNSTAQDGIFDRQGRIPINERFWIYKDGKFILSITSEELQELERRARESDELPIVLDSAALSLEVRDSIVQVAARFSNQSRNSPHSSVRRFDLQLKNCQLAEAPTFTVDPVDSTGIENQLVATDDGYRWLQLSSASAKHTAHLIGKSVVNQTADRQSLTLDLPTVGTAIDVRLPANATEEKVRAEDLIESRVVDDKGVLLKIRSRGGNFTLSWRLASTQAQLAAIEAKCSTLYEPADLLDQAQFWSATSTLTVRWYGSQSSQKIKIALPEGAQWSQVPFSEPDRFRITTLMPQAAATDADPTIEILEIENLDSAEYPVIENLKLQWRWSPKDWKVDRFSAQMTVPVPRLLGVDSHEGNIDLVFPSSYQVSYQEGPGTRFVQQGRVANLVGRQQIQFQYKSSEASLSLNFRKEHFQPVIQPVYQVQVRENRLELTGWLRCVFDTKECELGVIPGKWQIEEDLAARLIDASSPSGSESESLLIQKLEDGTYVLRSRESENDEGDRQTEQTWRFSAWMAVEGNNKPIEFSLPQIDRGRVIGQKVIDYGAGTLLVSSENNLLLQPDPNRTQGLIHSNVTKELTDYVPVGSRQPLAYRFQRNADQPIWRGKVSSLQRHVDVAQTVRLEIQENRLVATQSFDLSIVNRSLSELQVMIRGDATPIRATVAGYVLSITPTSLTLPSAASTEPTWQAYRIEGLPELIGDVQLSIVTSIPLKIPLPQSVGAEPSKSSIEVPLVKLDQENFQSRSIIAWSVNSPSGLDIKPADVPLRLTDNLYEIPSSADKISLLLQSQQATTSSGVITRGIWVQTLLNGTDRRDRFVVRLSSKSKMIKIQLPDQAQLDFRVAIDGRELRSELAPYDYSTHLAQITLPDEDLHTVEVFYTLTEPLSWLKSLELSPASVVDASSRGKFYWQLVTPDIFHLGWCPNALSAEWQWQWQTFSWNRVSEIEQSNLEQIFSSASLARLPIGTNSYVMSGYDNFPAVTVWIFSRFILWLPVGATSILLTVLALNIPILRTPTSFAVLCGVITGIAVVWPDLSLLLGQAAVISIGLVALVFITQAAVQTKVRRRSVFSTRPYTNTDISDHQSAGTRSARIQGSGERNSGVGVE